MFSYNISQIRDADMGLTNLTLLILYQLQHGFRDRRSCETQLLEFQADVLKTWKKAFDKVSHNHLLEKLKFYGTRGKTNTWIRDFLSNRRQAVVVVGREIIRSWSEIRSASRFRARTQSVPVLYQRHRGQHGINSSSLCWWHHCLLGSILHPRCRHLQNDLNKLGN